jgi:hypothetical protein
MMMSAVSPTSSSSTPRLAPTGLIAAATGKKEVQATEKAKLGSTPPAPQALTNDVFTPSVSLKLPADAPAPSSSPTTETNASEAPASETKATEKKVATTEVKAPADVVSVAPNEASSEKLEKAKSIMAETGIKFSAEKDPAKAKELLNTTYAKLKALNLSKEALIMHAMQLDVWDAAIVNLVTECEKPATKEVGKEAPKAVSKNASTEVSKETAKETKIGVAEKPMNVQA